MIAHARRYSFWHSDTVSGHATIDKCPNCGQQHLVTLYIADEHEELPPWNFLNGVRTPCGAAVDLILERTMDAWVYGTVGSLSTTCRGCGKLVNLFGVVQVSMDDKRIIVGECPECGVLLVRRYNGV